MPVNGGESRRVLTPLLCPFFQAQKLLTLALMGGVVIELELDSYDAVIESGDMDRPSWEVVQPYILVNVVQVDPALSSSYAKHLLEGKTVPISYHNFFSMQATNDFSLPIQRGFSRLSAMYVTFYKTGTNFVTQFAGPYPPAANVYPCRTTDTFSKCS